ncbi:MAG: AlpA family phage regulatory protein [Alphaproteobacteria bacterium]|nr:AlpA family phage regulatory protein [Alphaproteobacteria bacterium]
MTNTIDTLDTELLMALNAFLSEKAVMQATTLSRTSLHRKRVAGEFPEPEVLSQGRVGYRIRDIASWLERPDAWSSH